MSAPPESLPKPESEAVEEDAAWVRGEGCRRGRLARPRLAGGPPGPRACHAAHAARGARAGHGRRGCALAAAAPRSAPPPRPRPLPPAPRRATPATSTRPTRRRRRATAATRARGWACRSTTLAVWRRAAAALPAAPLPARRPSLDPSPPLPHPLASRPPPPLLAIRLPRPQAQRASVAHVSALLGLAPGCAALLLRAFRWNQDDCLSRYMEDPEAVCARAGVAPAAAPQRGLASAPQQRGAVCAICRDEGGKVSALTCGHAFCDGA